MEKRNLCYCYLILINFLHSQFIEAVSCSRSEAEKSIRNKFADPDYDPTLPPTYPTLVNLTFFINGIIEINEINGLVKMSVNRLEKWFDPRLKLDCDPEPNGYITLSSALHNRVWRPEITIDLAYEANTLTTPVPVRFVTVHSTGQVKWYEQMTVSIPCRSDYRKFPFDQIICDFWIGGNIPESVIKLQFFGEKRMVYPYWMKPATFELASYTIDTNYPVPDNDSYPEAILFVADAPEYNVKIPFKRLYGYYVLQLYLPNIVILMVTWLSLWYPPDHVRISICLSTLIVMFLQYTSISNQLPKVGYIKGVDFWMFGCLIFILVIMSEYTFLVFLENLCKGKKEPIPHIFCLRCCKQKWPKPPTCEEFSNWVDNVFRIATAAAFILFLIIYFAYNLS